jgi:hypothetical protein
LPRRFPPPWSVTDTGSSWEVRTADNFPIVWFCYGDAVQTGTNPPRMTREEAYAMAVNFARLPALLAKG